MTSIECASLPDAASDGPSLGHTSNPASVHELVGRTGAPASGRALVPTASSERSESAPAAWRPSAAFLTQLIATAQKLSQTRARRRAEPADASAVYAASVARCVDIDGTVCRSMWA